MSTTVFRPGALALISGGASGVGFAFASICRRHGMHLAIIDNNSHNLQLASSKLGSMSSTTHPGVKTETYEMDVSDVSAWSRVRDDIGSKFGTVDLLMLNAGTSFKPTTSQPWEDVDYFQKTLNINFFGIVNGLAAFLPLVQKSKGPSAVIFTGSKQGITNPPGNPAYNASKSAIKTIAEQLAHDLRTKSSPSYAPQTSVHLLIPGWTFTGLSGNAGPVPDSEALGKKPAGAWLPSQCAEYGYRGVKEGKFYIVCPDDDVDESLDQARMTWGAGDWIDGRSPLSRWDEKYKDQAAEWIKNEADKRREARVDTTA